MTTIYLIRHAQAQGNLDRTFQGSIDGKLTELGYRQLDYLAERCKELKLQKIYSSPLSRAYETAQAVNRLYGYEIHTDEGLLEINGGEWEGQKWASFEQQDPQQNHNWYHAPWDFCAPGGEPMAKVYLRLKNTILRIAAENAGKTVAVVSHGCAICNLITFAKGNPVNKMDRSDLCDNTAISKLVFDDRLIPSLEWQNDTAHLEESMKTFVHKLWEK